MVTSLKRGECGAADNSYLTDGLYVNIQSVITAQGVVSLAHWLSIGLLTQRPGFKSQQRHGTFFQNFLCFVLCYDFHVVRWGLDRNGLILRQNGFTVIINGDFLEEGEWCGR